MNQANNKDNLEKYKEGQLGFHKADNYQLVIERIKRNNQMYGYNQDDNINYFSNDYEPFKWEK